jgi:hypothetical protein
MLKQTTMALMACVFATALVLDNADARRGGGGGARAGGFGGGAGMRAGGGMRGGIAHGGARRAHVSQPIARPGLGNRPGVGGGDWGNRPGWGYRPAYGYGLGAAAIGAGFAYSNCYDEGYCGNYYNSGYEYGGDSYEGTSDAVAYCAQRFRSYDMTSQTYVARNGQRVSCP